MRNKVKIAAAIVAVVVGMVFYKGWFDRREDEKEGRDRSKKAKGESQRWN